MTLITSLNLNQGIIESLIRILKDYHPRNFVTAEELVESMDYYLIDQRAQLQKDGGFVENYSLHQDEIRMVAEARTRVAKQIKETEKKYLPVREDLIKVINEALESGKDL